MKSDAKRQKSKLEREARRLLAESGLPHEFRDGTRHVKIYIGDTLAMVLTKKQSGGDCRLLQTTIKKHRAALCN